MKLSQQGKNLVTKRGNATHLEGFLNRNNEYRACRLAIGVWKKLGSGEFS